MANWIESATFPAVQLSLEDNCAVFQTPEKQDIFRRTFRTGLAEGLHALDPGLMGKPTNKSEPCVQCIVVRVANVCICYVCICYVCKRRGSMGGAPSWNVLLILLLALLQRGKNNGALLWPSG